MKKLFALFLSICLILGVTACGNNQQNTGVSVSSETANEVTSQAEDESSTSSDTEVTTEGAGGKILVVYYSATGSTKGVAETIANKTGADLFELEPVEPYTRADLDWTNSNSRVSVEHDNEDARAVELVATTVDNWDEYETILIGYPIWWGIAAWPVDGFVKANDFSGKTVIPFCTSASSDLGNSGELLSEMAGTGDWQEGMRFSSDVSEEDVKTWVEDLDL